MPNRLMTGAAVAVIGIVILFGLYLTLGLAQPPPTTSTAADFTYTFTPNSHVKIESLNATEYRGQNGSSFVYFSVLFENVGTVPISVVGGCFTPLSVESVSNSSVIRGGSGPFVQCQSIICHAVNPGQSFEASSQIAPSQQDYRVVHAGTATVYFALDWSLSQDCSNGAQSQSTSVWAAFTFQ